MNNKGLVVLIFTMGVAVGSAATWYYAKQKFQQIAQEEIDSVKEAFSRRDRSYTDSSQKTEEKMFDRTPDARLKADHAKEKPGVAEYAALLSQREYTNYSGGEGQAYSKKPYVISPEDFGDQEGYDQISLSYYADNKLADENDELVEDMDGVVGLTSLSHFGEYEDDSVFVRNERLKCDFEILMDLRKYADVVRLKPHQRED